MRDFTSADCLHLKLQWYLKFLLLLPDHLLVLINNSTHYFLYEPIYRESDRLIIAVCVCVCMCDGFPGGIVHVVSAVCCHSRGWWFESHQGYKKIPSMQHLHHHTSLTSCDGYPALLWCEFTGHASIVMQQQVQVGLCMPTPTSWVVCLRVLARYQEFVCTGSQCLPSAHTSWLCQVQVTT